MRTTCRALLFIVVLCTSAALSFAAESRPNVLFIAIDDLRYVAYAMRIDQFYTTRQPRQCRFAPLSTIKSRPRFTERWKRPGPRRTIVVGRLSTGVFIALIATPIWMVWIIVLKRALLTRISCLLQVEAQEGLCRPGLLAKT